MMSSDVERASIDVTNTQSSSKKIIVQVFFQRQKKIILVLGLLLFQTYNFMKVSKMLYFSNKQHNVVSNVSNKQLNGSKMSYFPNKQHNVIPNDMNDFATGLNLSTDDDSTSPRPPICSHDELMKVRHQLPPENCIAWKPFMQRSSFTAATRCPKQTWLDFYYTELQKIYFASSMVGLSQLLPSSFLGISIGCNKGYDAINTLRMGTYDNSINKIDWKAAMEGNRTEIGRGVCRQDDPRDVFEILKEFQQQQSLSSSPSRPQGEMHCIEPMPQTYKRLNLSAKVLGYDQKGLMVTHAAVSKESGKTFFPSGTTAGVENTGLTFGEKCMKYGKRIRKKWGCKSVPVYSLKDFVDKHVKANKTDPINILSIDVEGFDGDVLLGASADVLRRVEYLEFEYNWMGSWADQHLYDITNMLDEVADMTCYWAGIDRLWRITDCWMMYFDLHTWANVACANRRLVPSLAIKMELIFQRTLDDDEQWVSAVSIHTIKRLKETRNKYLDHPLMSTDPDHLATKYVLNKDVPSLLP